LKILICYDISDDKIRNKLVKYLKRIAVRIQYSVFWADIPEIEITRLKEFAGKLLKSDECGVIAIYAARNICLESNKKHQILEDVVII
jgi:CRISPR-associated protein Cas2